MKKSSLFYLAVLSLCATGCNESDLVDEQFVTSVISATMEGVTDTRSHATDDGKFTWSAGDKISVYTSTGNFRTYTLKGEGGTTNANFSGMLLGGESKSTCAVYPKGAHAISGNTLTFNLPAEYGDFETAYTADTHAAMLSKHDASNPDKFSFKHLGGVLRFKFKNVPASAAQFVFTADKDLTGSFSVDLAAETPTIETTKSTGANSVTIKFLPLETAQAEMTVFIPMPIGEYSTFSIAFQKQDGTELVSYTHEPSTPNKITRRLLARFPEITFDDVNADIEGEDNEDESGTIVDNIATLTEAGTLATVLGDEMLTLTSLKVVGDINGTDVKCLRQMLACVEFDNLLKGKLTDLDLSEATIVEGGEPYVDSYTTGNNMIGVRMFYQSKIQKILLPYNVEIIGSEAFRYSNLTSVTFGDKVKIIANAAFYGCDELASITIPNSVTDIEQCAFDDCDILKNVTIPNSVKRIGNSVFANCKGLNSVTLGDGLETMGTSVFDLCPNLTNVIFGNSLKGISSHTFYGCSSLSTLIIPNSVSTIGSYAFSGCITLSSVTIPNSVSTIERFAFQNCSSLTSVMIPSSVTTIGEFVFKNCSNLLAIEVDEQNTSYCSIDGILYNKGVTNLLQCPNAKANVSIPNSVTTIQSSAFQEHTALKSVIIGNGVTTIREYTFWGCISLTSVTIGDNVTAIEESAFYGCETLTNLTIPNSIITIGEWAFYGCKALASVTIGDGVTAIEARTFQGCSSLASVAIGNNVTTIGERAFQGCSSLASVTIGDKVTIIGACAFQNCEI